MTNDFDAEVLEREANRWVSELVSGDATVADAEAVKRWCAQGPRHAAAFAAATRLWKDFGEVLEREEAPVRLPSRRRMTRRAVFCGAGALGVAACALIRPPLGLWPSFSEFTADYRTATGEQRHITLADNVSVRMNAQTSITVGVSAADADRVTVVAGEAVFTTPPRSIKPLEVRAGTGRTVANQARFEVRNINSVVCVTCLDGEVEIEHGAQRRALQAGRQVRYDDRGLGQAVAVNSGEAASWQDGFLIFRFTPLVEVIGEINRYRPGKVVLLSDAHAGKPVNGRFRIQRIDEVLLWIEQAFDLESQSLPGGLLLLS